MAKKIETDLRTFVKFWLVPLGIVLTIFILYKASEGLVIIGLSIFLALALRPLVRRVNNLFAKLFGSDKKHQTSSVVMAYLIVVAIIGAILAVVGPVVVNETTKFVHNFPETFESTFGGWDGINNFGRSIGIDDLQGEINKNVEGISNNLMGVLGNNLVSGLGNIAGLIMKVVLVLILTLLILLEAPPMLDRMWIRMATNKKEEDSMKVLRRTLGRMANVVSTYVSRQVMVAILDGCASMTIVFILSLIIGFSPELAIPMGLITMTFYLIPMFGQFIGGTLVTILLFFSNPVAALAFAIIYILYSQIENNVISPKIQGDALNMQPVVILSAIIIGMYMFGLLGAIIAIPITGCIKVLVDEYPNFKALRE